MNIGCLITSRHVRLLVHSREPSLMLVYEIDDSSPDIIDPIRGDIDIETFIFATTKRVHVAIGVVIALKWRQKLCNGMTSLKLM